MVGPLTASADHYTPLKSEAPIICLLLGSLPPGRVDQTNYIGLTVEQSILNMSALIVARKTVASCSVQAGAVRLIWCSTRYDVGRLVVRRPVERLCDDYGIYQQRQNNVMGCDY